MTMMMVSFRQRTKNKESKSSVEDVSKKWDKLKREREYLYWSSNERDNIIIILAIVVTILFFDDDDDDNNEDNYYQKNNNK